MRKQTNDSKTSDLRKKYFLHHQNFLRIASLTRRKLNQDLAIPHTEGSTTTDFLFLPAKTDEEPI